MSEYKIYKISVSFICTIFVILGLLLAVNQCLQRGISSVSKWILVVNKLMKLLCKLVDFVLDLFGGKMESNGKYNCQITRL
jgi:hypothetical protein